MAEVHPLESRVHATVEDLEVLRVAHARVHEWTAEHASLNAGVSRPRQTLKP